MHVIRPFGSLAYISCAIAESNLTKLTGSMYSSSFIQADKPIQGQNWPLIGLPILRFPLISTKFDKNQVINIIWEVCVVLLHLSVSTINDSIVWLTYLHIRILICNCNINFNKIRYKGSPQCHPSSSSFSAYQSAKIGCTGFWLAATFSATDAPVSKTYLLNCRKHALISSTIFFVLSGLSIFQWF